MIKNNIKTINDFVVKEKQKKYDTERISFLSHISHGIRTPLNAILGFSKLLVLKEMVNPKQKEYVKGILNGGRLLLQFVENIIDLSQFEARNYALRIVKCDINQVIWDYTESFYSQKSENGDSNINLMLVWDSKVKDLEIETDPVLLQKALQRLVNLVTVKYPIEDFEMGYRSIEDNTIQIFVRPANESLVSDFYLYDKELYSTNESDSFEYFNFKVLSESIQMLGGKLNLNSEDQEYSFNIPQYYKKSNNFKY